MFNFYVDMCQIRRSMQLRFHYERLIWAGQVEVRGFGGALRSACTPLIRILQQPSNVEIVVKLISGCRSLK